MVTNVRLSPRILGYEAERSQKLVVFATVRAPADWNQKREKLVVPRLEK